MTKAFQKFLGPTQDFKLVHLDDRASEICLADIEPGACFSRDVPEKDTLSEIFVSPRFWRCSFVVISSPRLVDCEFVGSMLGEKHYAYYEFFSAFFSDRLYFLKMNVSQSLNSDRLSEIYGFFSD